MRSNSLDAVVHPLNAVVGATSEGMAQVRLVDYSKSANFGSFSLKGSETPAKAPQRTQPEGVQESIKVSHVTLDELYIRSGRCPSFVKIDVEGMEMAVLEGAGRLFQQCKDLMLYVENNCRDTSAELLERLIDEHGYDVYWSVHPYFNDANFKGHGRDVFTDSLVSMNVLAIPKALSRSLEVVNFVRVQKVAGYMLENYMLTWKNTSAIIKQHSDCAG
jgi:FkbM family methyltransferase